MFRTIRWKLIYSISIPLLLTYLGMLGWDFYRQRTAAMELMQQSVLDRAESTAANLDARLTGAMQWADSTATQIADRPASTESQFRTSVLFGLRNPWIHSAAIVIDPRGEGAVRGLAARRGGRVGPSRVVELPAAVAQREWYAAAKGAGHGVWTGPHEELGDNRRACTYAVPIGSGEPFRGVVAVSIAVDELRQVRNRPDRAFPRFPLRDMRDEPGGLRERLMDGERRLGPTSRPFEREPATRPAESLGNAPAPPGQPPPNRDSSSTSTELSAETVRRVDDFGIFDASGRPIITPNNQPPARETIFETAESVGHPEVAHAARQALAGESHVVRVASLHEVLPNAPVDSHHWIAFAPIPATGWALVTVIPESTVMAPMLSRIAQRAAFLFGGSIVLLMVVLLVSIRISRPIEHLAGAVDRLAAGDLDVTVTGIRSRDEIGRLAMGFNQMTRQLKAHVAARTEETVAREKVESELRIARQIQTDMLPRTFPPFPDRPEFDLHAVNLPARRVAGDFYDFFFTPDGRLTVVIADVSGKGVPAALLMAVTRTIVRNLATSGLSAAHIAERTNGMLMADTSAGMFVTMLLCQYDPASGRLTYVNAGHPPPFRVAPGAGPTKCCDVQSPLLGVDASGEMGPFQQCEEQLAPGESIVLYTDGVTDARAPDRHMFGEEGIVESLRRLSNFAPEALARAMAEQLDQFQAGQRQDDITLLVLRRSAVNV